MSKFAETDDEYDDDDLHAEEEIPPDWVADEDLDLIDEDDVEDGDSYWDEDDDFYLDHKDSYEENEDEDDEGE